MKCNVRRKIFYLILSSLLLLSGCAQREIKNINSLDGIINKPLLKSDYIHPNAAGYQIMAERIAKTIQPIIELNLQKRKE